MRIRVRRDEARAATAELVVLPLASGEQGGDTVRALARDRGGAALQRAIVASGFRGRDGQVATMPLGTGLQSLCLVGLGEPGALTLDSWRRAAGLAARAATRLGARRVALVVDERATDEAYLVALVEGFRLATYRFAKYKSDAGAGSSVRDLEILAPSPPAERTLVSAWQRLDVVLAAVERGRNLVNEPAAFKTPSYLGRVAQRIGKETAVAVEVWGPARITAEKLAGLEAVARGSHEPPRFLRLRYRGAGARRRVALVGKGITFDSGGLSLKPAKSMETMKLDMAGGAAVLEVMRAIGTLKPAIDVEAFVPVTENLPGGRAQKPGDVIRYRNGKTVEVLNTDAEGRLVLADALILAAATKPDAIIDLATLTGACIIALGQEVAAIFGNDQKLVDRLTALGRETGETLWQLPLVPEYREDIRSSVADLKNIGGGSAGSITAALFLEEFVGSIPWVHLDIAGPAFAEKDLPYAAKGGTGFGIRTLVRYLLELAEETRSRPLRMPSRGAARGRSGRGKGAKTRTAPRRASRSGAVRKRKRSR